MNAFIGYIIMFASWSFYNGDITPAVYYTITSNLSIIDNSEYCMITDENDEHAPNFIIFCGQVWENPPDWWFEFRENGPIHSPEFEINPEYQNERKGNKILQLDNFIQNLL